VLAPDQIVEKFANTKLVTDVRTEGELEFTVGPVEGAEILRVQTREELSDVRANECIVHYRGAAIWA